MLRAIEPRIPQAVLIPLGAIKGLRIIGNFMPQSWKAPRPGQAHEIGISPHLFQNPSELVGTLLHEAAHAILFAARKPGQRHIAGCGPDHYYHRLEFRNTCRELGLECAFYNKRYGWNITQWPVSGIPIKYAGVLEILSTMPLGAAIVRVPLRTGNPLPKAGHVRLTCPCHRSIYVTPSTHEQAGILCQNCNTNFRLPKPNTRPS
jgi:hypothetical protein